jgi:hypothetical protein
MNFALAMLIHVYKHSASTFVPYAAPPNGRAMDAHAHRFREQCNRLDLQNGVQAALERSRSGNGGHVWIFFAEPVPARTTHANSRLGFRKSVDVAR